MNLARPPRAGAAPLGLSACLATLLLAACGGGGSSSDSASTGTPGAPTTPTPPTTPTTPTTPVATLTLTGTAARGSAIGSALVEARCVGGNGSATTDATTGAYTLTATGATLPCALRVTGSNGVVLHSIATGSGTTATAEITTVTHLVVARYAAAIRRPGTAGSTRTPRTRSPPPAPRRRRPRSSVS